MISRLNNLSGSSVIRIVRVHKQCTYYICKINGKKDISISLYYYSIPGGRAPFLPIKTLTLPIFSRYTKQEALQSRF